MAIDADRPALASVAALLAKRRPELTAMHVAILQDHVRFKENRVDMDMSRFAESEIRTANDYLLNHLATGDVVWRDLYLGHLLEQVHDPNAGRDRLLSVRSEILKALRHGFAEFGEVRQDRAIGAAMERFAGELFAIAVDGLAAARSIRILFVGDCFYENLNNFLTASLLAGGVSAEQEFISSRNPAEVRDMLRRAAERSFDLVCYSPYTNESSIALQEMFYDPNPFPSRGRLEKMAVNAHHQTESVLRYMAGAFECPIAVQTTRAVRRHDGSWRAVAKNLLTRRTRSRLAHAVNRKLGELVAAMNAVRRHPIILLDEGALTAGLGQLALGRLCYNGIEYHPSRLEREMAAPYRDLILAMGRLLARKLVVLDLDDTLWEGTIGEGAVRHHLDRQEILRRLRLKGILLAIASRNDSDKVHWLGALLQEEDFVSRQINWEAKPISIRRIAAELNLKPEHFVFIDDRADQRHLVATAIPEIECLDATAPETWTMLARWLEALPDQAGADRTQLYHERRERETFLDAGSLDSFDEAAMFAALKLEVKVGPPAEHELERVGELIARTNQFNVCASRCSIAEVASWSRSPDHRILVGDARDRFGEMGIVSAMVLARQEDALAITAWVLSCRVFGYGIETAMLNRAREIARELGFDMVSGRIVETPHNQPCREVYATNGFTFDRGRWLSGSDAFLCDPGWLTIGARDQRDMPRNVPKADLPARTR